METRTHIEYAVRAQKDDGTWKTISPRYFSNKVWAKKYLEDYLYNVEQFPNIYTRYASYMIVTRKTVTTIGEWEKAE